MSLAIEATTTGGVRVVLATKQREDSPVAQCAHRGCPTALQRSADGDLLDGVRAHYRTVHPERRIQ